MKIIRSLIKKFYKWKLPRDLQHMAPFYPEFQLKKIMNNIHPLRELKKIHKDDCVIIATGPSIKQVDISRIGKDKLIWGVNGAIALGNINFDLYTIVDSDFIRKHFAMVRKVISAGIPCLLSPLNIKLIYECDPSLLSKGKIYLLQNLNERLYTPMLNPKEFAAWAEKDSDLILPQNVQGDRIGFSKNITKGIFSGGTVVYSVIQAAYYIGCKKVYILGMDLGFTNNQPRFYDEGKKVCHSSLDKYYNSIIEPAFKILADFCQHEDFKVYNLSMNSRLPTDIIPKLNFTELFAISL